MDFGGFNSVEKTVPSPFMTDGCQGKKDFLA